MCVRISEEAAICVVLTPVFSRRENEDKITCGTHFGDTKLPASISLKPVCASLSINSIFVFNGMTVFSFCNPSRGPTSINRTRFVLAVDRPRNCRARRALRLHFDIGLSRCRDMVLVHGYQWQLLERGSFVGYYRLRGRELGPPLSLVTSAVLTASSPVCFSLLDHLPPKRLLLSSRNVNPESIQHYVYIVFNGAVFRRVWKSKELPRLRW
jgi:hypothetical protein